MANVKSPKRIEQEARLFAEIDGGKSVNAAAQSVGVDSRKAYAWNKARKPAADNAEIPAPGPPRKEPTEPTKVGKKGRRPITEETAAKLLEGVFLLLAVRYGEPIWLLDANEKRALGPPLADSLSMIPGPLADAVNTYAAPGVLITTLVGIIAAKSSAIAAQKAGRPFRVVPPYTAPNGVQGPRAADVPQNNPRPQPPPRPATNIEDLAAAVAAAKESGGLTAQDEPMDGEEAFR